ncbi:MAG: DEAD/DEAH box helicase [Pseudohongiellaceae bacterium]
MPSEPSSKIPPKSPLESFHPACRSWFETQFGTPTAAQNRAWPAIKAGNHTLISAPTGSGKTLAAFYAAIDSLIQRACHGQLEDGVHIVYVSPLKALSNDIRRNLEAPLKGIAEQLQAQGLPPANIQAAVRTGDTPASTRQKMTRNPPHILVTTPESLYLLLTSAKGRAMLSTVSTLIIDEIHAMLGDKRGSHLSLSVERLQRLVQTRNHQSISKHELQRIGLSATQKPIDRVARFLVGNGSECEIIDEGFRRKRDISIEVPRSPLTALMSNEVWEELYQRLVELIESHATTLVFVNTRRLAERLALALAERLGEEQVSSHHGSMSKDHRFTAEQKLKAGELKVLVATASMELGIDIGSVDLVVQFSSPKSIATFLQRVGRSGHSVHGTPKGILFPLTRDDLVEAAALLHSINEGELDQIVMPNKPMDILAQQIVAEVSSAALSSGNSHSVDSPNSTGSTDSPDAHSNSDNADGYAIDDLFQLFTSAYPYRHLSRAEFNDIVAMLGEGYTTRWGRRGAHLHLDRINGQVRARRGANLVALTNGGAIPDMFEYQVVLDPEDVVVGTLNEDFALETLPGDVFTLGTHAWQLLRVDGLKVRVRDATGMQPTIPFWLGEGPGRTQELSQSVSRLRQTIAKLLHNESATTPNNESTTTPGNGSGHTAAQEWMQAQVNMPTTAASQLVDYLQAGMNALGTMPTRETLVMERFFDQVGDMHVVIHTPFGSRLNRAWGLALRKRFCRAFNFELQAAANEDSIVISLGSVHSFELKDVFHYLKSATVQDVLVQALLDAPMFEVRWRWNATRALALQRNRSGKRVPPQFQRMDAEDFIAHVFPDQIACQENITGKREIPNHPLVQQTIHDCLTEAMDVDELLHLINQIETKQLTLIAKDLREPSPFAQEIINARPYAFLDDAPLEERRTNAIRHRNWTDPAEAGDYSQLDPAAIAKVQEEAWPLIRNSEELHDALLGLGYMTEAEFTTHNYQHHQQQLEQTGRITRLTALPTPLWIAIEHLPQFKTLFPDALAKLAIPEALTNSSERNNEQPATESSPPQEALKVLLRGRLEGLGPITATRLQQELQLDATQINQALIGLETEGFAFRGHFTAQADEEWCERRLLQRIHRYTIDAHRQSIQPVSLQTYTRFLHARHQLQTVADGDTQIAPDIDGQTQLQVTLSLLDGVTVPAASWESDILPSRIPDYDPGWLDLLCISGRVSWGRFSPPAKLQRKSRSGPIKSSPITLATRHNLDLWQSLAAAQRNEPDAPPSGPLAQRIANDLTNHGASFLDQIQERTGLLRTQLEEGLAELVSGGYVNSDSYTGLRALLTPAHRKTDSRHRRGRRVMFGIEDAGRWSLLKRPGTEQEQSPSREWNYLTEEQLERLITVYLQRWGVLFRGLLERESFAPPWRVLLPLLRRMELRGILRGGRFVAGVGGEQFAHNEIVDQLRKLNKTEPDPSRPVHISLSATDPLNLINLILPNHKLPRLAQNRVLFRDGIPIAMLESGNTTFLRPIQQDQQWPLQQALVKRTFPPQLRSYLGK